MKFRIGDRVKCTGVYEGNYFIIGMEGKIVDLYMDERIYGVEYDREFPSGHTCNGSSKRHHGWNTHEDYLELVEKRLPKVFGIVKFMKDTIK